MQKHMKIYKKYRKIYKMYKRLIKSTRFPQVFFHSFLIQDEFLILLKEIHVALQQNSIGHRETRPRVEIDQNRDGMHEFWYGPLVFPLEQFLLFTKTSRKLQEN